LYQHRDDNEAKLFLDHLVQKLDLPSAARVLDLACGKGRHSLTLAQMGFEVVGADLAPNSILAAQEQAEKLGVKNVAFCVHDMRQAMDTPPFDAVFNLFTSFGYFDDPAEDERVLENMAAACVDGGYVVQDYLNAELVLADLPQEAVLERGGYRFKTKKHLSGSHIVKDIEVLDGADVHEFQERVRIFSKDTLVGLHEKAGLKLMGVYGDYGLGDFDPKTSPRIVVISQKG
jgi:SAM-dependent methyltransferase